MGTFRLRIAVTVAALALIGCDTLFPEFSGMPPMSDGAASGDGGVASGMPHLAGRICGLGDVRDYRTCSAGPVGGPFRISVEETRDATLTDGSGAFTLVTARPLSIATVGIVDTSGTFTTTVTALHTSGGVIEGIALPVVPVSVMQQLALANGVPTDDTRGAILAWAVDATGAPVAGVRTQAPPLADGPFYEGAAANEVASGLATRQRGMLALFDVSPSTVRLELAPPQPYQADGYDLPVRPNALTLTALPLH